MSNKAVSFRDLLWMKPKRPGIRIRHKGLLHCLEVSAHAHCALISCHSVTPHYASSAIAKEDI